MAYFSEDLKLEPYWWEEAPRRPAPPAEIPKQADVVVVGSGYAGVSTALTVARGGRSAIVFDAQDPGLGACSRNGGAVGETLRISFAAMIEQYGMAQAIAYYKEVKNARAYVEHLIESEDIRCHYARVGRFMGAYLPQHYESLARDMELRQEHIGFDAEMVSKAEQHRMVGTDDYHGGRLIRSDANLHPALFHQGLLDRAIQAGVTVVGRARVTAVEREGKGFIVTAGGNKVAAREVVIASNGYTGAESPWLRRRLIPIQSQIIATAPIAPELIERLIPQRRQLGDTCKLHYYYRTSPDGARILFGGRAGGAEINDPRRSGMHLHRRLIKLFPEIADIRIIHSWAGFIAYTFDALPHMASHDGIHYVSGFCGSGVAMANYLGHKTGLKVLGSSDAANAFDSPHPTKPLYTGTPWFMPAVIAYYGWRDRMRI